MQKDLLKIVLTALFAALTCVATMIIKVPTIGTGGYVNIGDTIVLLCAWLIGGVYGALAAGIGSGLADLLNGYAMYVPGTFVIKFLMAAAAYGVYKALMKAIGKKTVSYIVSSIVAEVIMILGYFLYESTLLGYGLGAAVSIGGNVVQGVTCIVLGIAAVVVLEKTKATEQVKKMCRQ